MHEARGNVTEYGALALPGVSELGFAAAVDECNSAAAVRVAASQPFIHWPLPAHSSQYIAVTAFTAAGCNSSLTYKPVFIDTKHQQGLQMFQIFSHVLTQQLV